MSVNPFTAAHNEAVQNSVTDQRIAIDTEYNNVINDFTKSLMLNPLASTLTVFSQLQQQTVTFLRDAGVQVTKQSTRDGFVYTLDFANYVCLKDIQKKAKKELDTLVSEQIDAMLNYYKENRSTEMQFTYHNILHRATIKKLQNEYNMKVVEHCNTFDYSISYCITLPQH